MFPKTSHSQTHHPVTEPNYVTPTTRPFDKTKPSATLVGEVNIANGTANYTLPISVPPGIQGMQPNLAITYNSNGGNGQLGLGWALAGASAFSRGGSSYFVDEQVAPVNLDIYDNLFLDGQRCVPYGSYTGFYAGDEYRTLTKSYQKIEFIDSDIIKVTQKDGITRYYGGANARLQLTEPTSQTPVTYMWFLYKVEDRNGNYMTYDYVIDANNEARLNNINYTANNLAGISAKTEIQFHYTTRTDARSGYLLGNELHNSLLLHEISVMHNNTQYAKYTLNYMFDQTPKLGNDFSKLVEIQYQAQTKELNSVVVKWNLWPDSEYFMANNTSYQSNTGKYGQEIHADFNNDGVSDILALEYDSVADGSCTTNFKTKPNSKHRYKIVLYRGQTNGLYHIGVIIKNWFYSQFWPQACERTPWAQIHSGDFNGDGLIDFVLATARITGNSTPRHNEYRLSFYENNALTPGSFIHKASKELQIENHVPVRNGQSKDEIIGLFFADGKDRAPQEYPPTLFFMDLNADGLTDFIYNGSVFNTSSKTKVYQKSLSLNYSNGDFGFNQTIENVDFALDSCLMADFNGDGSIDIINLSDIGTLGNTIYMHSYKFGYDLQNAKTAIGLPSFLKSSTNFLLDYNGDGLTDIITFNKNLGQGKWKVFVNNNNGFLQSNLPSSLDDYNIAQLPNQAYIRQLPRQLQSAYSSIWPFELSDNYCWPIFRDINGDGKTDFLFVTKSGNSYFLDVCYNRYGNLEKSTITLGIDKINVSNKQSFRYDMLKMIDYEGDGRYNLVYGYNVPNNGTQWRINFRPHDYTHYISSILDGTNTLTTFTYKPLTDDGIYARGNTENYPNPVITAPLYVVSQLQQELFDSTAITDLSYEYEGARVNSLGLGLLGFEKITTTDVIQGRRNISTFALPTTQTQYTTQPMLPKKSEVFSTANNTLLASTEYTYYGTVVQTDPDILPWQYNPQVFEEKSKDWVHGTSAKTSYIYDGFGNISSTVSHTYNNTGFTAPYVSRTEEVASYNIQHAMWYLKSMPQTVTSTVTRYGQSPATKTTNFTYDDQQPNPKGNLTQQVDYPGEEVEIVSDYTYFSTGNVKTETITPLGMAPRETEYTYTADGRFVETETNTKEWKVSYEYDDLLGLRTKQTDFNSLFTEWEYDEFGRVTREIAPDGTELNKSYTFYTGQNSLYLFKTTTTGTAIPPAEEHADGLGRVRLKRTKNRNDDWVAVRTDFDSRGRKYRISQPFFPGTTPLWNTTSYDDHNRPTAINSAAGKSISYSYNGRTTTVTNTQTNQSTSSTVDADGLTLTATDEGGNINYQYNSFGKPINITGPSGTPILAEFDAFGRQVALNDAAAGPMTYTYDPLGQLIEQTDNDGNTYTMVYDELGRITQKTGPEGIYSFVYDATFKGLLNSQTAPNGISFTTQYDGLGRKEDYEEIIDGQSYAFHYTYNTYGQLQSTTYPNNFGVNYIYDNNGYTSSMTRSDNNEQIWSFGDENRFGQTTEYTLGNNLVMELNYDPISGLPMSIDNGQKWGMAYDFDVHTGNLNSREHLYKGLTEDFEYDNLDRLVKYNTAITPLLVSYANTGNITFKGDAGRYTNDLSTGRTTSVDHESSATSFEISDVTQNITYTAFNSVETIMEGDYDAFFTYGPHQQRSKMLINHQGSAYIDRMYLAGGQYERDRLPNGQWRNLTYMTTPTGLNAVYTQNETTHQEAFYFIHTDYQGSIMALTDYNGQLVEEYSYDPWGNRRNPNTWQKNYTNTTNPGGTSILYRGYTFHEQLDCFALINMNGRMYDPVLGRMLSADNYVQSQTNTQNLNRYSYVLNNPLKYTDPSGEIIFPILMGAGISVLSNGMNNYYNNRPFLQGAFGAAIIGGIGGAASFGIGNFASTLTGFSKIAFQTAAHGMLGTMMSTLSGGSPGQGFISGAVSSLTAHYSHKLLGKASRGWQIAGMVSAGGLSGGLSAKLAGANFWDGARNGLISSGLNHGLHLINPNYAIAMATGRLRHLKGPDAFTIGGVHEGSAGIYTTAGVAGLWILRGDDASVWPYALFDAGLGLGAAAFSASGELMLLYSSSAEVSRIDFYGERTSFNVSGSAFSGTLGGSVIYSEHQHDNGFTIGLGMSFGGDAMIFNFFIGVNHGRSEESLRGLNSILR